MKPVTAPWGIKGQHQIPLDANGDFRGQEFKDIYGNLHRMSACIECGKGACTYEGSAKEYLPCKEYPTSLHCGKPKAKKKKAKKQDLFTVDEALKVGAAPSGELHPPPTVPITQKQIAKHHNWIENELHAKALHEMKTVVPYAVFPSPYTKPTALYSHDFTMEASIGQQIMFVSNYTDNAHDPKKMYDDILWCVYEAHLLDAKQWMPLIKDLEKFVYPKQGSTNQDHDVFYTTATSGTTEGWKINNKTFEYVLPNQSHSTLPNSQHSQGAAMDVQPPKDAKYGVGIMAPPSMEGTIEVKLDEKALVGYDVGGMHHIKNMAKKVLQDLEELEYTIDEEE